MNHIVADAVTPVVLPKFTRPRLIAFHPRHAGTGSQVKGRIAAITQTKDITDRLVSRIVHRHKIILPREQVETCHPISSAASQIQGGFSVIIHRIKFVTYLSVLFQQVRLKILNRQTRFIPFQNNLDQPVARRYHPKRRIVYLTDRMNISYPGIYLAGKRMDFLILIRIIRKAGAVCTNPHQGMIQAFEKAIDPVVRQAVCRCITGDPV